MVAVRHDDLSMAFDFVSYAAPTEHNAYVSLDTGKIYWTSDSSELTKSFLTTLKLPIATLRSRTGTTLIWEDVSPCALSLRCYRRVTTRPKNFSGGKALMRVSRICWSVKAFSSAGIRSKPMPSKAR